MAEEKPKKVYPELKGSVKTGKPSTARRIASAFVAQEVHDVKDYVIFDVVIPAIKRTFRDLVMNTLDMTFFGKSYTDMARYDDRRNSPYVSYNAYSRNDTSRDIRSRERERERTRSEGMTIDIRHLDRIEYTFKQDAQDVIDFLQDNIEEYGYALVADFLGASKMPTNSIHSKWGWYDIGNPEPVTATNGTWFIRLPKPRPID